MTTSTIIFAIVIVLIVLINRRWQFDPSIGETHPHLIDKAQYPKFYVHGVTALACYLSMYLLGVPLFYAVFLLGIGIFGYEWSQRFYNPLDVVAGFTGIALAIIILLVHTNVVTQGILNLW